MALFQLVARIPYPFAAYIWLALSLVAIFGGAVALSRCAHLPPIIVAIAFSIEALLSLGWGQIVPIAFGALCFAAYAADVGRMWLVAVAVTIMTIEPHVGLPAVASAAFWLPKARGPLAICVAVVGLTAVTSLGVDGNVEYFAKVTPLHVLAEVSAGGQYSLTWLLHALGVPATLAIDLGSLSYVTMVFLGIAFAGPIANYYGSLSPIVLFPVACAVLGGPFVHSDQVALALPVTLFLIGRSRRNEPALWLSVSLLSVLWWIPQWQTHPLTASRIECAAILAILGFYATRRMAPPRAYLGAIAAPILYLALSTALLHVSAHAWNVSESPQEYARMLGGDIIYASGSYGELVREHPNMFTNVTWQLIATKIPFWLGALILVVVVPSRLRVENFRTPRAMTA